MRLKIANWIAFVKHDVAWQQGEMIIICEIGMRFQPIEYIILASLVISV